MPDFKTMYVKLFQSQTKAIRILQETLQTTEDMYIESEPPDIKLLTLLKNEDDPDPETPDEKE